MTAYLFLRGFDCLFSENVIFTSIQNFQKVPQPSHSPQIPQKEWPIPPPQKSCNERNYVHTKLRHLFLTNMLRELTVLIKRFLDFQGKGKYSGKICLVSGLMKTFAQTRKVPHFKILLESDLLLEWILCSFHLKMAFNLRLLRDQSTKKNIMRESTE